MALPMQRSLLRSFVQSMHEEGIVNDDFYQLLAMKETVRPDYVVRAVTSYCLSAQNLFSHLTYHICQPEVDYHQVNTAACEFYARTSSCSRALYWTKNEYSKLRRKFETLVQYSFCVEIGTMRSAQLFSTVRSTKPSFAIWY
ncbi:hypothetical protein CUMW_197390 [Citrus unshiu]|nr:hypothetical protein CUMW_197390 [Citrus unshiu]